MNYTVYQIVNIICFCTKCILWSSYQRNCIVLRQLCEWKGINILEVEACDDHGYLLIEF